MESIRRNHDILTGKDNLELLYSFPNFPVFMGTTTQEPEQDIFADMNWWIGQETGILQLNPLLPLDILYPESHNAGGVGGIWARHHEAFADFVHAHGGGEVLEIGGGHGILAKNYVQKYGAVSWTIVEQNPAPVQDCPANYVKGFFDSTFTLDAPVDTVVHSHVFEHIYEPAEFVRHLADFMKPGAALVFSVPNMEVMLNRKYLNFINFEHTAYLNESYIKFLLENNGFNLKATEYFLENHSIFFSAEKNTTANSPPVLVNSYELNKRLCTEYIDSHKQLIREINNSIESHPDVFLFGAHIFALYLIAFGLNTKNIRCILDNDPSKQGRRLYGTNLQVKSPAILKDCPEPVVILHAGVFDGEIKKDILENINAKTLFI